MRIKTLSCAATQRLRLHRLQVTYTQRMAMMRAANGASSGHMRSRNRGIADGVPKLNPGGGARRSMLWPSTRQLPPGALLFPEALQMLLSHLEALCCNIA